MRHEMLVVALASLIASGAAGAAEPVNSRVRADFAAFAGSPENADSLASGLRGGSPITLSSTDAAGVTTTNTFSPATGRMGNGNVYISLALAKQQLSNLGITQPTPEQIRVALNGGSFTTIGSDGKPMTTTMTGVLELRSQGMGWGKIAQTYGYKLGPVISGMKAANSHVSTLPAATTKAAPASGVTNASGASSSGVTTAAGGSSAGNGQGNAYGRGITTAGGGASAGQGGGNAYGRGITTGASGTPGNSGNAGQGKGGGKGG